MTEGFVAETGPGACVTTHNTSLTGLPGFIFWTLITSFFLLLIAFSTIGWQVLQFDGDRAVSVGLWKTCYCGGDIIRPYTDQSWFKAVQAFITLAFICLLAAVVLVAVYMFVARVNKTMVLISFTVLIFTTFAFLMIGVTTFGVKSSEGQNGSQGYSFVFAVIAMVLTLALGGMSLLQMRASRLI